MFDYIKVSKEVEKLIENETENIQDKCLIFHYFHKW